VLPEVAMLRLLRQVMRNRVQAEAPPAAGPALADPAHAIAREILAVLGRSPCIRAVDAGSCNACELELHALGNPYYNLESLGMRFVASPRHADLLLVTGPVSTHMELALRRTYEATPEPRRVVAIGECACDGGCFGRSYASLGPVSAVIPVDVLVTGCPPAPVEILKGILAALQPGP
jgi:Ni,Fe-hydrogenase III small subunit